MGATQGRRTGAAARAVLACARDVGRIGVLIAAAYLTLPRGFEGCLSDTPYEDEVDRAVTLVLLGMLLSLVAGLVALPKGPPVWESAMRNVAALGFRALLLGIFVYFAAGGFASC